MRFSDFSSGSVRACIVVAVVISAGMAASTLAQVCDPNEVTKLIDDAGSVDDRFGYAVSQDGDLMAVGAMGTDDLSGAVHIRGRDIGGPGNWGLIKTILPSDPAVQKRFGAAVAISGDTVIVGAERDSSAALFAGAAYIFQRDMGGADNWGQVVKLLADDAAIGDRFGAAVSIDGDRAVVGALGDNGFTGAAYVFDRNEGGADAWGQTNKLTADDGDTTDYFGFDVVIEGDLILCSAWGDDIVGIETGSAYLMRRNGDQYDLVTKIMPSDPSDRLYFGYACDLNDSTIIIGAYGASELGEESGAAYLYARNQGGPDAWGEQAKITAADGAAGNNFGFDVTISGDFAVAGSPFADNVTGTAHLFRRNQGGPGAWGQMAKLTASDGAEMDRFGRTVCLDGSELVVGAPQDDIVDPGNGAVYLFDTEDCQGPQLSADGTCPGGGTLIISWTGATPNTQVVLLFARGQGSFVIPSQYTCAGTVLGLNSNQIQIGFTGTSGPGGNRSVSTQAGSGACGGYLQLLQTVDCVTSNTAQIN